MLSQVTWVIFHGLAWTLKKLLILPNEIKVQYMVLPNTCYIWAPYHVYCLNSMFVACSETYRLHRMELIVLILPAAGSPPAFPWRLLFQNLNGMSCHNHIPLMVRPKKVVSFLYAYTYMFPLKIFPTIIFFPSFQLPINIKYARNTFFGKWNKPKIFGLLQVTQIRSCRLSFDKQFFFKYFLAITYVITKIVFLWFWLLQAWIG